MVRIIVYIIKNKKQSICSLTDLLQTSILLRFRKKYNSEIPKGDTKTRISFFPMIRYKLWNHGSPTFNAGRGETVVQVTWVIRSKYWSHHVDSNLKQFVGVFWCNAMWFHRKQWLVLRSDIGMIQCFLVWICSPKSVCME